MRVILASESQFRRRALDMLGLAYETCPSGIDEKAMRADTPGDLTRKLAEAKAHEVAKRYRARSLFQAMRLRRKATKSTRSRAA